MGCRSDDGYTAACLLAQHRSSSGVAPGRHSESETGRRTTGLNIREPRGRAPPMQPFQCRSPAPLRRDDEEPRDIPPSPVSEACGCLSGAYSWPDVPPVYTLVSPIFEGTMPLASTPSIGGELPMLSSGGESEIVRVEKIPFISRRSSEVGSFGATVRSCMKSLIERMMFGQFSSLGNHQSECSNPHCSSIRFRSVFE